MVQSDKQPRPAKIKFKDIKHLPKEHIEHPRIPDLTRTVIYAQEIEEEPIAPLPVPKEPVDEPPPPDAVEEERPKSKWSKK